MTFPPRSTLFETHKKYRSESRETALRRFDFSKFYDGGHVPRLQLEGNRSAVSDTRSPYTHFWWNINWRGLHLLELFFLSGEKSPEEHWKIFPNVIKDFKASKIQFLEKGRRGIPHCPSEARALRVRESSTSLIGPYPSFGGYIDWNLMRFTKYLQSICKEITSQCLSGVLGYKGT